MPGSIIYEGPSMLDAQPIFVAAVWSSTNPRRRTDMNHCSICKVQLDQPGMVETLDCGGDCIGCMAEAGDPDASRALREEIKKLRGALGAFLSENERLHADMQEIHTWLTNGDNSRLPHRVGCARSIAGAWLEDTPKTLNKEN